MKKIKRAKVTRVALCRRGKNGMKTLFKAEGKPDAKGNVEGTVEVGALVKGDNIEQGELLAVVYAPNKPDADGDFADAEVIKSMQRGYMRDHQELDIEHEGKALTREQAYVAESFLIAKGDDRFKSWKQYDGTPTGDLTGAWGVVIQIEDPALRKAFREDGWDGVSLFGTAAVEQVDTKAASQRVAERLSAALNKKDKLDMDKEAMLELLKSFGATLKEQILSELKPKKEEVAAKAVIEPPSFEGDPTNPTDLEKFEKAMRGYELRKALAEGKLTAAQITEMRKALEETQPSDEDAGIEKSDTSEVKTLKRQLFKAKKRSNAPAKGKDREDTGDDEEELLKANVNEGREIAKLLNERRGFAKADKD
jgi:hypothetical protein